MKQKQWMIAPPDEETAKQLAQECGLTSLTASVLAARGFRDAEAVRRHLSSDLQGLHDPMRMHGIAQAATIIRDAVDAGDKIVVCGDYDVDGITSTCIMVHYLRSIGADCDYYIPNRLTEGYGISNDIMHKLAEKGANLLVTVDTGISANEEVRLAHSLGMRIVVTDHHECHDTIPEADAVVDPKQPGCTYPFASLAGVGVAFKLLCALSGDEMGMLERYADMVALGTVADVMPLVEENRVLVTQGLKCLNKTKNLGLQLLLAEAGMQEKEITASVISFVLAPRINAAGRMGVVELAAELFLTQDKATAAQLAQALCEQNKKRQSEENKILQEALTRLQKEFDPLEDKMIFLVGENWHHGVIGIVCSRLCDRYGCPVVLISADAEMGKGSGRSVQGFNLFEAFVDSEDLLFKYGGHELAAGLTVRRENIEDFGARLKAYANQHIRDGEVRAQLFVDSEVKPAQIDMENIKGLSVLQPFGMQNAQPIFYMRDMQVEEITPISSDQHVKVSLVKDDVRFASILFGTGSGGCGFAQGNMVDAAFHLEINEFRGRQSVQLVLKDVVLSECEDLTDQKLLRLYRAYMDGEHIGKIAAQVLLPERAALVAVWRYISCRAEAGRLTTASNALSRKISWESRQDINIGKLFVCLDTFSESQLISYHFKQGMLHINLKPYKGKANISDSVVLATLREMAK